MPSSSSACRTIPIAVAKSRKAAWGASFAWPGWAHEPGRACSSRRAGESAAERAAEVLGTLRGVAAKVGQMASYVDGVVPEGQREAYELALQQVARAGTHIEQRGDTRLGRARARRSPSRELFRDWEDEPVASASIGQVHRARLRRRPCGRSQSAAHGHRPGHGKRSRERGHARDRDRHPWSAKASTHAACWNEVKARFREELDYSVWKHADQREFAQIFRRRPADFSVPQRDRRALVSKRVLTSEFVVGFKGLDDAATRCPRAERRSLRRGAVALRVQGQPSGRHVQRRPASRQLRVPARRVAIAFLDFGCVQPIHDGRHRTGALAAPRGGREATKLSLRAARCA